MRSLAVVSVLLLAGCSASEMSDSGTDSAVEQDSSGGASDEAASEDGSAPLGAPAAEENRQFVTEGSVSYTVADPSAAAQEAAQLVEAVGGHVQERVEQGGSEDEPGNSYLVVRIPSTEVTGTLARLKELGTVEDTSLTSTEVTAQARDLDARIRALQISVSRLEDLLSRAGTIADVVEAEQVLTQRQSELESLQSQAAGLADQVQMATFRLNFYTEGTIPEEPDSGFWAGLVTGWNALVATLSALLQAVGVILPWLVFAGLLTAGAMAIARWYRRRRPATAPASASFPSAPMGSGPTTALPPDARSYPSGPVAPGWPAAPTSPPAPPAQQQPAVMPVAAPVAAPAAVPVTEAPAAPSTQAPGDPAPKHVVHGDDPRA